MFILSQATEVVRIALQKSHLAKLLFAGKLQKILYTAEMERVWFAGAARLTRMRGFSHTNASALLTLLTTTANSPDRCGALARDSGLVPGL